jgi:hypothetical protein
MQPTESIASLTDRSPLTESTCAQLAYAFCRAAQETGLSRATTDRYQAWAVAFLSWCQETAPHCVHAGRIGAFERALRERPGIEEASVHEALDALGFLFGAVENIESILPSGGTGAEKQGEGDRNAAPQDKNGASADNTIQSLRIGWQDETDPADAPSPLVSPDPELRPEASNPVDEADEKDEEASSAETWIQWYESQITSADSPNDRAADASRSTTAAAGKQTSPQPE